MTTEEFQNAWEYLRSTVANVMMVKLGLDDSAIIKHVLYFLLCFGICIPLFLLMIALWDQSTSFVSVTQSLFIGITGAVASNRSPNGAHTDIERSQKQGSDAKVNAETQDKVTRRVDNVISRFMS